MNSANVATIIKLAQMDAYARATLFDQVLAAYPDAVIAVYKESGVEKAEDFAQFGGKFGVSGYTVQIDNAVRDLINRDRWIDAIKHVRSETRAGLKESKDLCDHIRANDHLSPVALVRTTLQTI